MRHQPTLSCHCCGNGVKQPEFADTPEGNAERDAWNREVDNFEGNSPIMCDDCEATFTKVKESPNSNEPVVIRQFRGIVNDQSIGGVKDGNGKAIMIDLFSASAVIAVYDALNDKNKAMFVEKCGKDPYKMCTIAFKLINKQKR